MAKTPEDDFYVASDPAPERLSVPEELAVAEERDAELRLTRLLDRIHDRVAEIRAHDAESDLDPDVVPLLEEITGLPDAPLEQKSLRRRVHEHRTTWKAFWLEPGSEAGGLRLFNEVNAARIRTAQEAVAGWQQRHDAYLAEQAEESEQSGPQRRHPDDPGATGGIGSTPRP
jgi:hypothetical protein